MESPVLRGKSLNWNLYAIVFILFVLLIQIGRSYYYPQFLDEYFHLHRAWALEYQQGFSVIDNLQASPVGRSNLYPPFYHSLIYMLHRTGQDWISVAKILSVSIVPLFCLVFYFIFRKSISGIFSFMFVLLVFSNYGFLNSLINNIPATLSMIFWAMSFFLFIKKRYLASSLFLSLCFYTHPFLGYIEFILLFIWALHLRKQKALWYLISLAVASPFIILQAANRSYVSFQRLHENILLEFKIVEIILCIAGLAIFVRGLVSGKCTEAQPSSGEDAPPDEENSICRIFALVLVTSVIFSAISGYHYRFLVSQGFLPVLFFAAYTLTWAVKKLAAIRQKVICLFAIFAFFMFLSPTFVHTEKGKKLVFFDSFFMNSLKDLYSQRPQGLSIWFPELYEPVVSVIEKNSSSGDIISADEDSLGVMFSLLAQRPTSSYMFREVRPFRDFSALEVSTLAIYLKYMEPQKDLQVVRNLESRGFTMLADTDIFYIFKNRTPLKHKDLERGFTVDMRLILFFWLAIFSCIIFDCLFARKA